MTFNNRRLQCNVKPTFVHKNLTCSAEGPSVNPVIPEVTCCGRTL